MKRLFVCVLVIVCTINGMKEKDSKKTFWQGVEADFNELVEETGTFLNNLFSGFIKKKNPKPAPSIQQEKNQFIFAQVMSKNNSVYPPNDQSELVRQVITKALEQENVKVLTWFINNKIPEHRKSIDNTHLHKIYNLLIAQKKEQLDDIVEIQKACTYIIANSSITEKPTKS